MIYKIHTITPLNQLPTKVDVIEKQETGAFDHEGFPVLADVVIGTKRRFIFQILSYVEGVEFIDGIPTHLQSDMTHIDMDTTEEGAVMLAMQAEAVKFMAEKYPNT